MQDAYNTQLLSAIEADFDYHLYPTTFTLEQIRLGDTWLRDAALAVLADSGFIPNPQLESVLEDLRSRSQQSTK